MTRVLAAAALVVAAFAGTASAEPLGNCGDRRIDVACQTGSCDPEQGCQVRICVLWVAPRCVV